MCSAFHEDGERFHHAAVIANNSFIVCPRKNKIIFPPDSNGGAACRAYLNPKR